MSLFGIKCPKCGGHEVKKSGESFGGMFIRNLKYVGFLPLIFIIKKPPTFYFCKNTDCGFEWSR